MNKIHKKLLEKYSWYANWHNNPKSPLFHWAIFVVTSGFLSFSLFGAISSPDLLFAYLVQQEMKEAEQKKTMPSSAGRIIGSEQNHVLVKFKQAVSDSGKNKLLARQNLKEKSEIKTIKVKILTISEDDTPEEVVDRLRAKERDFVEFAEVDAIMEPALVPNDPSWAEQWDKQLIGAPSAWDNTVGLSSITVGVADTGVNCAHEDLSANCVAGWNFYDNNSNTSDVYGHGTAVAGIIAAIGNNAKGVAGAVWNSKIMPLRISAPNGYASWSAVASAITYAADHGVKVVNNSYQSGGSSTVRSAAKYLKSKGGLLTVSEGNSSSNTGYTNSPDIINVSASDPSDNLYSFSSFGDDVDVSAPGCGTTTSADGSYRGFCGTSNSAPETAGALMLIFSAKPGLTPDQAQNILFSSARDLGVAGWDQYFGWGRVDAGAAVTLALGTATPAPDSIPPTAPTNLFASAPASNKVNLSWNASVDNIGVAGYRIYRNSVQVGTSSLTSYIDNTVSASTSYAYYVQAYDSVGNISPSSNVAYVTTPAVSVSITNYSVGAKTSSSAVISWTTNVPSTGFVSYGTSSANLNLSATSGTLGTSHSVKLSGLSRNRSYYYKITATSEDGKTIVSSPISNFRTLRK